MKLIKRTFIIPSLLLAGLSQAVANPSNELIQQYNLAAAGDSDKVELVFEQLNQLIQKEGAKPLSLVYLGSTQTMQGRDAWMPWNKMQYVEQGLATIDKGLNLIASQAVPVESQPVIQGLPDTYLARALSAATFSQLPDMFNHFDRGYDLYIDLLAEPEFEQAPFAATSWVYSFAIETAIRAEDQQRAQEWLAVMLKKDASHPETQKAQALVNEA
ncbi:hypothetical protein VINI7043_15625 [Vibrio nigripulchritudo ATCC 27043]|uniref:hypothetical protein n=1 Tax=Vibrio nigripulchritudo TaxID=28173 RepID=UPI00021C186A|nr:hypothetical protein [Vibrio nigripulchritudo]EGU59355.1 hypothetical protein VINI7043_15625 [Vibrio nigripulchritudo ATCC 27043]